VSTASSGLVVGSRGGYPPAGGLLATSKDISSKQEKPNVFGPIWSDDDPSCSLPLDLPQAPTYYSKWEWGGVGF